MQSRLNAFSIVCVLSVEPVSTTIISKAIGKMDSIHLFRFSDSFFVIMQKESFNLILLFLKPCKKTIFPMNIKLTGRVMELKFKNQ